MYCESKAELTRVGACTFGVLPTREWETDRNIFQEHLKRKDFRQEVILEKIPTVWTIDNHPLCNVQHPKISQPFNSESILRDNGLKYEFHIQNITIVTRE